MADMDIDMDLDLGLVDEEATGLEMEIMPEIEASVSSLQAALPYLRLWLTSPEQDWSPASKYSAS